MSDNSKTTDYLLEESNPTKKMRPLDSEVDVSEAFTPREYQIEILESALEHNTIACLGTGTGKTFIAVLLIREMARQTKMPFDSGGKRIFFLVPTVPLVHQQAKVIETHTELTVGQYFGEMNVDTWDANDWQTQFVEKQVLVMTGEICRIILDHSFIPVSRICLLIFDECHSACGNHPYAEIMRHISSCKQINIPKIFGLTASLLNGKAKPSKVERKLQALEATLLSKIVTVSDYDEVMKYGTDPDELIVLYESSSESLLAPEYVSALNQLRDVALRLKDFNIYSPTEDSEITFFVKPQSSINQVINIFQEMGPWCATCAAKVFLTEIDHYLLRLTDVTKIELLQEVKKVFNICISTFDKVPCDDLKELTNKLSRFLEIFEAMRNWQLPPSAESSLSSNNHKKQNQSPVCIVFVEQRIVAYVLCKWIEKISEQIREFSFMKANFIVGHGTSGAGVKESQMSVKKQQKIVKKFRDREFNILIATSVLEEGMDIQKCNVVVRFDVPKNFRSYVQSKGRARAAQSKYIILLPKEKQSDFMEDYCTFKVIENFLLRKCRNRTLPDEEMVLKYLHEHPIPPYQPLTAKGSPRVTLHSAISLINRYCSMLPSDMACKLTARWKVELLDPDDPDQLFVCTLRLPINSPLRKAVKGQPMKQKKLTKMAAALETCKLLHQIGELNDHLLPFKELPDVEAKKLGALEAEVAEDGLQAGTNKRRQLYTKEVADVLKNNIPVPGGLCYLHVVVMELVVPLAKSLNPRERPIVNPADSSHGFALLTTKKLPKVPQFPIFTKNGKIRISVSCVDMPFHIDASQLQMVEKFHQFLFCDTLHYESDEVRFNPRSSGFSTFIVPVITESSRCDLDWDFIKYTLQHDYNSQKLNPQSYRLQFSEKLFKNAVVTRTYHNIVQDIEKSLFYIVNKICYDKNPNSSLGDLFKFANFTSFLKKKYDIEIQDESQPMLEVEPCFNKSLTTPLYTTAGQLHSENLEGAISQSKLRHANYREYFVPELCIVHPFPSALFRKASYLPSILHRLNYLLVAEQIRSSVSVSKGIGTVDLKPGFQWPVFNFERSDEKLRRKLVDMGEIIQEEYPPLAGCADILKSAGEICSFEVRSNVSQSIGPSPSTLLLALTTKSAADEFDLERLETIGDSFLKYAVSVKIFASYPQKDEGHLTFLRSQLICNRNLYQLAKKKDLPKYIIHRPFLSKQSWIPPCYETEERVYVKNSREDKKLVTKVIKKANHGEQEKEAGVLRSLQLISDKSIADSVEALIGAYLLSSGQDGALGFMSWIGVDPYIDSDNKNWPPVPRSPFVEDIPAGSGSLQLLKGFEAFQQRIKYTFKEPGYLLQAFTHASYCYNELTDCYQRLEFLGDAVLDYLITRKLYDDPKEHDPGKLTDLRAALVNNIYFASLAVKYGYHKNLKCLSVTLCKLIDQFINMLTESEAYKSFEEYGYYLEELECFDLEEVEVPKALGDLFESVAGAIYLDSGMSLDAVWNVYYPMMKPAIEHLSERVPLSPVRELLELVGAQDIFVEDEKRGDRHTVTVKLPGGQEFVGIGPNKKVAKRSAAKRAVYYLKFEKNA